MAAAGGLLLAIACIAIVAVALGIAVASWSSDEPAWGPRVLRGAAITLGVACLLLAALHPAATLIALLPRTP